MSDIFLLPFKASVGPVNYHMVVPDVPEYILQILNCCLTLALIKKDRHAWCWFTIHDSFRFSAWVLQQHNAIQGCRLTFGIPPHVICNRAKGQIAAVPHRQEAKTDYSVTSDQDAIWLSPVTRSVWHETKSYITHAFCHVFLCMLLCPSGFWESFSVKICTPEASTVKVLPKFTISRVTAVAKNLAQIVIDSRQTWKLTNQSLRRTRRQ